MMTAAGAVFMVFALVKWWVGGINAEGAIPLLWCVPLMVSCLLADVGAAAGMAGIEKITEAGESAITKVRMSWRDRR
ncbi:hypothetical protein [Rhodoferax sp.]|uniref:hypothetical protein n=1 Tax=Rhodoferax sp. TaxID=50421 RepID=UPI003BB54B1B